MSILQPAAPFPTESAPHNAAHHANWRNARAPPPHRPVSSKSRRPRKAERGVRVIARDPECWRSLSSMHQRAYSLRVAHCIHCIHCIHRVHSILHYYEPPADTRRMPTCNLRDCPDPSPAPNLNPCPRPPAKAPPPPRPPSQLTCSACGRRGSRDLFSGAQRKRPDNTRKCTACVSTLNTPPPLLTARSASGSVRRAAEAICFIRISSNASQGWKYTPMSTTTYSKETFQLVRAAENVPVKVQSILAKLGR
jgi:hypothetical protein